VVQKSPKRRRFCLQAMVLALGLWALAFHIALGQDILRQSFATPGNSRPIQLNADDITTWAEDGKQIFLLKGRVWVEQGSFNLRAGQAVVWVDQASKKETGIYNLQVYGETVSLEDGKKNQTAPLAFLQFGTRGEVRITSYAKKQPQRQPPVILCSCVL
jgi:lipopolysaccharide export system protein LptA